MVMFMSPLDAPRRRGGICGCRDGLWGNYDESGLLQEPLEGCGSGGSPETLLWWCRLETGDRFPATLLCVVLALNWRWKPGDLSC